MPGPPDRTPAVVSEELHVSGIRLPDRAIVVRGGQMNMSDLEKSAEKALVRLKRPGLSVFAADVPSAVDVLNQAPQIRHPVVCVSTLARLREAFDVEQTFDPPHHTVWLPGIDEPTLELFALAFDEPVRREVLEDHARGL